MTLDSAAAPSSPISHSVSLIVWIRAAHGRTKAQTATVPRSAIEHLLRTSSWQLSRSGARSTGELLTLGEAKEIASTSAPPDEVSTVDNSSTVLTLEAAGSCSVLR